MAKKLETLQEALTAAKMAVTSKEGRLAIVATALGKADARPAQIAAQILAVQAVDAWTERLAKHGIQAVLEGAVDTPKAEAPKAEAPKAEAPKATPQSGKGNGAADKAQAVQP